ncbi:hypothetical protein WJX73_005870 [Symbiochloris irregularis]|uniref:Mini-chromosome maintenance complex-binding protein n=1 Tax=Symbiochloris irregularis TaxID=706552 RepID=A0AAW1P193_9CHLO
MQALQLVDALFEKALCPTTARSGDDWGVGDRIKELLQTQSQVPLLTPQSVDQVPTDGVCRYVGLVQDTLGPECYVGAYQQVDGKWRTTKYRDAAVDEGFHTRPHSLWDRKPVYCVRPTGQMSWLDAPDTAVLAEGVSRSNASGLQKRPRSEDMEGIETLVSSSNSEPSSTDANGTGSKHPRQQHAAPGAQPAAPATCPEAQEGDCLVYIYDVDDAYKVNDVIEVVGVLSRVPELAVHLEDDDSAMADIQGPSLPPTSKVPRLHALLVRKVSSADRAGPLLIKSDSELQCRALELRPQALKLLSHALGGDQLSAEYLLLQLLSRVHTREGDQALGALSVNLVQSSAGPAAAAGAGESDAGEGLSQVGQALQAALACLLPYSCTMAVGPDQLNSAKLVPKQSHTTKRLERGGLQMAEGTHLLLDESHMKPGRLNPNGINNLQALKHLLEAKVVDYDFEFYKLGMPADVVILILSRGKALLQHSVDVTLPLHATEAFGERSRLRGCWR